jgi:hypothetical protein
MYSYLKRFLLFTTLLLVIIITVQSQTIKNKDLVYDKHIQTVLLYRLNDQLTDPVIELNTDDKLVLEFDDLSDESYNFRYTIIHCDRDWNQSDLNPIDYIEGFTEGDITKYDFSLNAIPSYIHYRLVFPNSDMKINFSGNYIIKVYMDNDDDENVILTRRFFVVEPQVTITTDIPYYPKKLEFTKHKQQIDLTIQTPNIFNMQADQRIRVFIQQNGRWDNLVKNLKPTTVFSNKLEYNYSDGIVFDGGNQFRYFDMKSFYYQAPNIAKIISDAEGYEVILHTDNSRASKEYETYTDIFGRKLIKARNDQETNIEGEYAWVDFSLRIPKFENADVYIIGALNDWQLNNNNRMQYDSRYRMYTLSMFLKQGYYNYMYGVVAHGETKADVTLIEGDHWETQNDYKVYVYYRNIVPEYDRLVGFYQFTSFAAKK